MSCHSGGPIGVCHNAVMIVPHAVHSAFVKKGLVIDVPRPGFFTFCIRMLGSAPERTCWLAGSSKIDNKSLGAKVMTYGNAFGQPLSRYMFVLWWCVPLVAGVLTLLVKSTVPFLLLTRTTSLVSLKPSDRSRATSSSRVRLPLEFMLNRMKITESASADWSRAQPSFW
ncbi:Hypothetical predicted protein [Prunus dulcis]|uniref:Uncharacterized protein n=1 Tax=Prunus dulcis TaxID=3755 RepID=A0A5E4FB70_PRUDU|nr:hypothetical protein L3X38_009782 [Prunus dulcis]VVA25156.1 Hypothetical predicted protein [Prunus dulcis]